MTAVEWSMIARGVLETLEMTLLSSLFAYIGGFPLGVLLYGTAKGRLMENRPANIILGVLVNIGRSIPFLIFLVLLIPVTRFIVGTSIGTTACVVPLTIGAIPIVARMVESSLGEVDAGVIEAAQAMGASPFFILVHCVIPEAMPSLLMNGAINVATILGYSAMAGVIGGGGLGDIALRYGYYRYQENILFVTVAILVVLVMLFQESGIWLSRKNRKS